MYLSNLSMQLFCISMYFQFQWFTFVLTGSHQITVSLDLVLIVFSNNTQREILRLIHHLLPRHHHLAVGVPAVLMHSPPAYVTPIISSSSVRSEQREASTGETNALYRQGLFKREAVCHHGIYPGLVHVVSHSFSHSFSSSFSFVDDDPFLRALI